MVSEVYRMGGKGMTKGYEPSHPEYSPNKHGRLGQEDHDKGLLQRSDLDRDGRFWADMLSREVV